MDIKTINDLIKYINNENIFFTLDRFEGNFAVCENRLTGDMINIYIDLIPNTAVSGDILKVENNKIVVDIESTSKEKESIQNLARSLFKKKK